MKPSLLKIFKSDYRVGLLFIIPLVCLLLFLDLQYFGILQIFSRKAGNITPDGAASFLKATYISSLICLPIAIFRIHNIFLHFRNGVSVMGIISEVRFYKDRGAVDYTYMIDNEKLTSKIGFFQNAYTKTFQKDDPVELIVCGKKGKYTALIKNMYV